MEYIANLPKEDSATIFKNWQFYLIFLAGEEIHRRKEDRTTNLEMTVMESYKGHLKNFMKDHSELMHSRLQSEATFLNTDLEGKHLLTGEIIWRKFGEARREVQDMISEWIKLE